MIDLILGMLVFTVVSGMFAVFALFYVGFGND